MTALERLAVRTLDRAPSYRRDDRPSVMYEEWVYLAGHHPRQAETWRNHEHFARERYRAEDPLYVDLGGET